MKKILIVSLRVLNVPANIEMEILDVALVNVNTTEGEELNVRSLKVILEESSNSDAEDEVAGSNMGSNVEEN